MASPHIQKNLDKLFRSHRVVFWYDAENTWAGEVESLELTDVALRRVNANELALKLEILREKPNQKFLVYSNKARPSDADNWLLDILLSHGEFHADRASLNLQEVELPLEFKDLAMQHEKFFGNKKRKDALKATVKDASLTHRDIRRHMMAILVQTSDVSLDGIILKLVESLTEDAQLFDPVETKFGEFDLAKPFWEDLARQFNYHSDSPTLLDFVIGLFEETSGLGGNHGSLLKPQASVFMSRWKDSQNGRPSFEYLSRRLAKDLEITQKLGALSDSDAQRLVDNDVDHYEQIEQFLITRFRNAVMDGKSTSSERKQFIDKRSRTAWFQKYDLLYRTLEHAASLLELIADIKFDAESLEQAIMRYQQSWWKVDFHYRKFDGYRREVRQVDLLGDLSTKVEKVYLNEFLGPLATKWEGHLDRESQWPPTLQPSATTFFNRLVAKLPEGQKLFVIISDGFRFECAMDLRQQILREDRFTAEIDYHLAPLPSYTQLGMAALLPNAKLRIGEDYNTVYADDSSTSGLPSREKILNKSGLKIKTLKAEEFLELKTKEEGRPLMKEHDVVFIYHNQIDEQGDRSKTEKQTSVACDQTINEIIAIIKKVTNINASNILVTADHGFLFQQSLVDDIDKVDPPKQGGLGKPHLRFVFGNDLRPDSVLRVLPARSVGLDNDFQVGIVKGVQRLKVQGVGYRYVHGGAMPQEVIVPVLSINKARKDDIQRIDVEIQNCPAKVTTMSLRVRLFQKQAVSEENKVLGRELEVGMFDPDGHLISNRYSLTFDSVDTDPRNREKFVDLVLDQRVTEFNNQNLELRLLSKIEGANRTKTYASTITKFIEGFTSEIDDFS